MKRTGCLLLLLCLALYGRAQFIYNPLPVKGSDFKKIGALGYTRCSVYKTTDDAKILTQVAEYGAQGYLAIVFERGVNEAGDSINVREEDYKYGPGGRLDGITFTDKETGETDAPSAYTYDAKGRLIKRIVAVVDPPTYRYKYDAKGRLAEVNETQTLPAVDSAGTFTGKGFESPSRRYTYHYDAKGQLAEEWEYNLRSEDKAKPEHKLIWTYSPQGQIVRLTHAGQSPSTDTVITTYTYNEDGLLASSVVNDNGEQTIYSYEWCKGCKQSWMQ